MSRHEKSDERRKGAVGQPDTRRLLPTGAKSIAVTVLIVGSGFGGLYCAKRLEALLRADPST